MITKLLRVPKRQKWLQLEEQLKGIGYEVSKERGDYENGELTVDN